MAVCEKGLSDRRPKHWIILKEGGFLGWGFELERTKISSNLGVLHKGLINS